MSALTNRYPTSDGGALLKGVLAGATLIVLPLTGARLPPWPATGLAQGDSSAVQHAAGTLIPGAVAVTAAAWAGRSAWSGERFNKRTRFVVFGVVPAGAWLLGLWWWVGL